MSEEHGPLKADESQARVISAIGEPIAPFANDVIATLSTSCVEEHNMVVNKATIC